MLCEMCLRYCTTRLKPRIEIDTSNPKKIFYFCSDKCKNEWKKQDKQKNGNTILWKLKKIENDYRFCPEVIGYAKKTPLTFFAKDL